MLAIGLTTITQVSDDGCFPLDCSNSICVSAWPVTFVPQHCLGQLPSVVSRCKGEHNQIWLEGVEVDATSKPILGPRKVLSVPGF